MALLNRLRAAWHAFKHAGSPVFAVIYDVPEIEGGERTGDATEEYYEAFDSPAFAAEMFRSAYPTWMDNPPENARLVLILDDIDSYRRQRAPETRAV